MANITERRKQDGSLSFYIRVYKGRGSDGKALKPYSTKFDAEPSWSDKTARKKAEAFASVFEKECLEGTKSDARVTFQKYCDYVIELKENRGLKHSTVVRYKDLAERINGQIGHIRLKDLRVEHLNSLYTYLSSDGLNKRSGGKLSNKTIIEHHRLISTVLEQALKENLIPFNPAQRTNKPKVTAKDVNYFQIDDIKAIRSALESEPLKWKTIVHLLLLTGARRGELLGLKWENVDFTNNRIYICNNILYSSDIGVYESTPKTEKSKRYISLPQETMTLLKQYKSWQTAEMLRLGADYARKGFVFTQYNGLPMNPDGLSCYLRKFSAKYNLPHINPHAFRHTMASMLYFNNVDSVSISKRLGHAQVSTTANIYAHVIEQADKQNAEILSNIFLKNA